MNLSAKILRFLKDESGPTAVEYAVMLALLLIVMFQTIRVLGEGTNSTFERTNSGLENVRDAAS
jgi:pilus assembly protein Flp/PilA